ncbi:hypothetical protein [Psychromonas sp. SR45-3]|uniref:hypothetical protein n=1 Tax=Psychromonas sp. SR45-3 TaxID=2760930 RepID=UPI0015FDFAB7|nr:hypothetical protein [Psychromonas sp. SR45-3]MBB1272561.1 hypothetical protein [Psychromonas sp. SR45-3]
MSRVDKFYDLLEAAEDDCSLERVCPDCGSPDCKYAVHDHKRSGCDVSIVCNECRKEEAALAPDFESIINHWYKHK